MLLEILRINLDNFFPKISESPVVGSMDVILK